MSDNTLINIKLLEEEIRQEKENVTSALEKDILDRWMGLLTGDYIRKTIRERLEDKNISYCDRYKIILVSEVHFRIPGFEGLDVNHLFEVIHPPYEQSLRMFIESRTDMKGASLYAYKNDSSIGIILDYRHPFIVKTDFDCLDQSISYECKLCSFTCTTCCLLCCMVLVK
jgi:hypothetical protein